MAEISNADLRTKLDRRMTGLAMSRKPWEPGNREVARYCQRWHSRYMRNLGGTSTRVDGGAANERLFNSKAVRSIRTLTSGLSSGMSSESQPWFLLKWTNPEIAEMQAGKEWIDDSVATLRQFLSNTTIYTAMDSGYRELGLFGVEAGLMVPHWKHGAACYSLTFGEYWLGQDDALRTDTLYRDASMTVAQVFDRFDEDKISQAAKRLKTAGKLDAHVEIRHAIEPNRERSYGKIDRTNMEYRSVYWEPGNDTQKDVLEFGGFNEKPFWAPRWDVQGMEVYAAGPGFDCLPDSRKLQLQELRLQGAMDFTVRPPLQSPVANRNAQANLIPGGITYSAATDMAQGIRSIWDVPPAAIPNISADIQRTEMAIDDATYANLFMAITQMQGVQPRNVEEIARRHEEQLAQLGPVVGRVNVEKLSVIVLQAFSICSRAGLFRELPEELDGQPLNIEFVSVLAQAQKMIGLGAMERFLGFVGNIAGVYPAILDKPDFDQMVDEYGGRLGVPARSIRSDDMVTEIREGRAQAEQQEKMAAMMPAMQAGAKTAELLSKTDVGGRSLLDGFVGGPGV